MIDFIFENFFILWYLIGLISLVSLIKASDQNVYIGDLFWISIGSILGIVIFMFTIIYISHKILSSKKFNRRWSEIKHKKII